VYRQESFYKSDWSDLDPDILAYNMTYKEVIRHNLPTDPRRVLVKVDEKSRHRMDNLLDYLPYSIPSIRRVFEGNSKDDDLLQVVDLLVGCIHGELTKVPDPLKRALTDDFRRRCGTRTVFQRPTKCSQEKVNVWRYHPSTWKRAAGRS
jgi:hypothetical protein